MENKCMRCGSIETYTKREDYIANNLCEYDITCSFCEYPIDYYAYGYFESDCPQKQSFCWHNIKLFIKFIFQCVYYRIKRRVKIKKLEVPDKEDLCGHKRVDLLLEYDCK